MKTLKNEKALVKALLKAQDAIMHAQSSLVDADHAIEQVVRVLELKDKP